MPWTRRRLLHRAAGGLATALLGSSAAACAGHPSKSTRPKPPSLTVGGWNTTLQTAIGFAGIEDYNPVVSSFVGAYNHGTGGRRAVFQAGAGADAFDRWYGFYLGTGPPLVRGGPGVFTFVPDMQQPDGFGQSVSNVAADLTGALRSANVDLALFHPAALRACQLFRNWGLGPAAAPVPILAALPVLRDPLVLAVHRGRLAEAGLVAAAWDLEAFLAACGQVAAARLGILSPLEPWGGSYAMPALAAYIAGFQGNTTTDDGTAASLTDGGVIAALAATLPLTLYMPPKNTGGGAPPLEAGGHAFAFRWLSEVVGARRSSPEVDFVPLPPAGRAMTAVAAVGFGAPNGRVDEPAVDFLRFAAGDRDGVLAFAGQGYGLPARSALSAAATSTLEGFTGSAALLAQPDAEVAPVAVLGGLFFYDVWSALGRAVEALYGTSPSVGRVAAVVEPLQAQLQGQIAHDQRILRQTQGT